MRKNGASAGARLCWESCLGTAKFWIESADYGYDDISYMHIPDRFLALDTQFPYVSVGNTDMGELISILFNEKNRC